MLFVRNCAGWVLAACLFGFVLPVAHAQEEPLHTQIDALLETGNAPRAGLTTDAAFLRRITLDLTGRIPTADETRQFLADTNPDKRTELIDRLLASPDYATRMAEAFHVMLLERAGDHPEWMAFLQSSFAANKPLDQMCREILHPNPEDEAIRGAAFFFTKRLENYGQNPVDLPGLARDVGRLFLGMDLQCAQCHDHLFIDDYKQADFQGLFSYISHTSIRRDTKFPAVAEALVSKKTEFMSVFVKEPLATGPRLPGGAELEIPEFPKGEEFAVVPDRKTQFPGIPKFSPLSQLAERLANADNPQFAKNLANRIWFMMLGRGIVHPLDLHHSDNPPSHPELLELLGQQLVAHQFDMKWFLRELTLSRAYQRSSLLPEGATEIPPQTFAVALERPLSTEQLLVTMLQATGEMQRLKPVEPKPAETAEKADGATVETDSVKAAPAPLIPDDLRQRFVKAFANPAREPEVEFAPSVKAALFVMNDSVVLSWTHRHTGNLVDRLTTLNDPAVAAEEMYLSVLTRLPTDVERADVAEYLAQPGMTPEKAYSQMVWALMASTEFCVNH